MRRAYIFNTGCIRRALDSTRIYHYLVANGWMLTNNIRAADLVIVTTCSAVDRSEELSTIALGHVAKKVSDSATVVVAGCLPKVNPGKIAAVPGLNNCEVVPTGELERFDQLLGSAVPFNQIPDANLVTPKGGLLDYVLAYRLFRHSFFLKIYKRFSTNRLFLRTIVLGSEGLNTLKTKLGLHARDKIVPYYNLRIAEGCAFACTYCCIHFATGRVKSKPIDDIVAEFKEGLKQGHKVFQLVCEDVGCYGLDIKTTFPELLKRLLAVPGDYQLVMIDFGGYWLVKYYDELLPLFMAHPTKVRELYVALQSGSNKILRAMKRPEKIEDVEAKLKDLKAKLPHLILRTTVIIGFPGETEQDFQETVRAVQGIDFAAIELNSYEDRPGTAASRMSDKIPQEVIDKRIEYISQFC